MLRNEEIVNQILHRIQQRKIPEWVSPYSATPILHAPNPFFFYPRSTFILQSLNSYYTANNIIRFWADYSGSYYEPYTRTVKQAKIDLYNDPLRYFHQLFHETAHTITYIVDGFQRNCSYNSNTTSYAKEEVYAELCALLLSKEIDIDMYNHMFMHSVSYIKGWLCNVLYKKKHTKENKKKVLMQALRRANKAVDYLISNVNYYGKENSN